jgi:ribonuclease BN (tRNA processing enzyme)
LVDFARDVDVAVCEATLSSREAGSPENSGHMTAAQAGEIAQRAGVRHLILTHLWAEHDLEATASDARSTFAGAVTIAAGGVQVVV